MCEQSPETSRNAKGMGELMVEFSRDGMNPGVVWTPRRYDGLVVGDSVFNFFFETVTITTRLRRIFLEQR